MSPTKIVAGPYGSSTDVTFIQTYDDPCAVVTFTTLTFRRGDSSYYKQPFTDDMSVKRDGEYVTVTEGPSAASDLDYIDLFNTDAGTFGSASYAAYGDPSSDAGENFTDEVDAQTSLTILRETHATLRPSASTVKNGKKVKLKLEMEVANWDDHDYVAGSGERLNVQYRQKGTSTYATVGHVTSDHDGRASTTVAPKKDGYYRVTFRSVHGLASVKTAGQFIDVT